MGEPKGKIYLRAGIAIQEIDRRRRDVQRVEKYVVARLRDVLKEEQHSAIRKSSYKNSKMSDSVGTRIFGEQKEA